MAGGLQSSMSVVGEDRTVDLGGGYLLREILAPHHMLGRSLQELAIREKTGVQVLLMRSAGSDGKSVRVPSALEPINEGEVLIVAGSENDLKRLDELS